VRWRSLCGLSVFCFVWAVLARFHLYGFVRVFGRRLRAGVCHASVPLVWSSVLPAFLCSCGEQGRFDSSSVLPSGIALSLTNLRLSVLGWVEPQRVGCVLCPPFGDPGSTPVRAGQLRRCPVALRFSSAPRPLRYLVRGCTLVKDGSRLCSMFARVTPSAVW